MTTITRVRWARACVMLLVGAVLLLASGTPRALAGDGSVSGKKANISVYFTYDETDENLAKDAAWHNVFKEASKLLYNATEGQLQFGHILVYKHCPVSLDKADFVVVNDNSGARANLKGLGVNGRHIWISQTHKSTSGGTRGQFGCIHEWGHYHFGLWDEYIGEKRRNNAAQTTVGARVRHNLIHCVEDANSSVACIMDGGTTLTPENQRTEFCTDPDVAWPATRHYHGGLAGGFLWFNMQGAKTAGKSCWQSIAANTSLTYPTSAPTTADPAGHETPTWEVVTCKKRIVACIDRSGSMSSDDRLGAARSAASLFTYFLKHRRIKQVGSATATIEGDEFGVTSFDHGTAVNFPLQEIVDAGTKASARGAIGAISLGGSTSIGGGLRTSLNQILGFNDRVSGEAIVLLSDGYHNSGEHPSSVIPDLKTRGVKVFSVALGSGADQALLQSIASQTGGEFYFTAGVFNLARIFLDLQARTAGGQLVFESSQTLATGDSVDERVEVDSFTGEFTVVFSPDTPGLTFRLLRPNGTEVDPNDPGEAIEHIVADSTESYRVEEPAEGTWKTRVTAEPPSVQDQASVQPAAAIPDYTTTSSTIDIASDFTIANMTVDMGITHTRASDLRVTLWSPQGTQCELHRYGAGTANGLEGTYPTTLEPRNPLNVFAGEDPRGTWRLDVYDAYGGDTGTLDSWGMEFFTGVRDEAAFDLRLYSTGTVIQVTPGVSDPDVGYPEPVVLSVSVVAEHAVTGADVTAHVETPDGDTLSLPMFDDGALQHGDAIAQDGTYSTRFSSFTSNGTYRVRIDVMNDNGFAAPALMEDGPYSDRPIEKFSRTVTQEFRVSGVPTVSRRRLRVDSAKLVQGRAEKDSLKLKGRLNATAGTLNPDDDDLMLQFGSWQVAIPAGTMKRKGSRDKWSFKDGAAKLVLDLFRGGGSQGRFAVTVKKTDLDNAVDTRFPVSVRMTCGDFDQTIQVTMEANEDPTTGGVYRIGANNVTPTDVYVDVFAVKRSKKAGKDKLVALLRHPGVLFNPDNQAFTLRLGTVELLIPAGSIPPGKKDGVWQGKLDLTPPEADGDGTGDLPVAPPDEIVPQGMLKVVFDSNQRTIRLTGKNLDLADVPNPAILDLIFGFSTYRAQIRLGAKKRTLVY